MGRILLVDDDDDNRFAVVEAIRRLTNHAVDEDRDGPSALRRLQTDDYDLVLLDVQMPGMDGFEVCRRLRADQRTRRLPVLFLTATQYQIESRLKGLELGADDFIVQPVSNHELVARIKAALRVKALADEVQDHNRLLETKVREGTNTAEHLADELRAERDNLRQTFDVFDEALLLFDASGGVLVANAAGRRLNEAPLASELSALVGDALRNAAICDRALSSGGKLFVGRAYPVSGSRVLLYLRDVTEERDGEMRRLQAEKLASIGMLAAGVAHEINNPAAFVLGNIEALSMQIKMIKDQVDSAADWVGRSELRARLFEAISILQESKEGMARIQRIVRDLSAFSHIDDDRQSQTDINDAVGSTLTLLKNELRHRATVETDLRATRRVRCGQARLGQVFLNLIMNAAQALNEADVNRNRIVVRTFDRQDDVVFEVSDNGPGIDATLVPRIFDSFYTTKPRGVGTGLGLPISQGIVRSLGGDINVETSLGRGATFRVHLPSEPALQVSAPVVELAPPAYRRRRVLAVDDEALLLKAYRRMLADVHDIATALGARDALLLLEKDSDFDLILCDLQMPETSGMDLFALVKARYPHLGDRFVFVTGGAFSADAKRFLDQAVTCLSKPFRIEELLSIIEQRIAERADQPTGLPASKKPMS
ncbi:MAG: response regulator [Verrucomicrobiota bacterium]